ncbi:MAG: hypothetical protein P9L98_03810 [Candidatus Kaelpia imicola]|nr:hypothetical protein [Candidatus Kaelpia imicola]
MVNLKTKGIILFIVGVSLFLSYPAQARRVRKSFKELSTLVNVVQQNDMAKAKIIITKLNMQPVTKVWLIPVATDYMSGVRFTKKGNDFVDAIGKEIDELAKEVGFDIKEGYVSDFVLVVTELISNIWKYAQWGLIIVSECNDYRGIEIIAIDNGEGIEDVERVLRGDFVKKQSPGTGLELIQSKSSYIEVESTPGKGTTVMIEMYLCLVDGRRVVAHVDYLESGVNLEPPRNSP